MPIIAPILYMETLVDRSGQLWRGLDDDYVKDEEIPPVRSIIMDLILTTDNRMLHLDHPQDEGMDCDYIGVNYTRGHNPSLLMVTGQRLVSYNINSDSTIRDSSLLSNKVELLIQVIKRDWYNIILDINGNYMILSMNRFINIDNMPKLSDIKLIRNSVILTNTNEIYYIRINNHNVTVDRHQVEFNVIDITEYYNNPIALDDKGKLWIYDNKWYTIKSRIIDVIGIREFILLSIDKKCDYLTDGIYFIGGDGYAYGLSMNTADDIVIEEYRIPFHLFNSIGGLGTKRSLHNSDN